MIQLKAGTILRERYRVIGLIGAGGMGSVYLADDNRLEGRRCALKEQALDGVSSQSVRNQFHQEASILARLDHPGLPKVSDYFYDEECERDYLVMDYVPGQNLDQLVKRARRDENLFDEQAVLGWIDQLCDILSYLHSRKPMVLHRDIKPANIKLMPDGRLKLVDFGLAKPFDPNDPRTVTGLQGLGSLPYTPLEQYVGHVGHTDARADLYSLGATCYHLITGQTPASAHDRFLNPETLVAPQIINPGISERLNEAIMWAMQLHPNDRPPSVSDWRAALTGTAPLTKITPFYNRQLASLEPDIDVLPLSRRLLRDNLVLGGACLGLFILALVITFGR